MSKEELVALATKLAVTLESIVTDDSYLAENWTIVNEILQGAKTKLTVELHIEPVTHNPSWDD
jgi:hypothetical protein